MQIDYWASARLSPMNNPPPIRACHVCAHARNLQTLAPSCYALAVCGARIAQTTGVPCHAARALSGPCGPEARFLEIVERKSKHA